MFRLTEKNQKWWVLVAMTSCISMIFIDISVLPVALPTIQRMLDFSDLGLQWTINAYTLALTVFLLAGGRLGDRYGHRKIFSIGLFTFAFSSALCGLSQVEWWFITSRLLQGMGGAMLIPTSRTIIFSSFPPKERGKALGIYVSIGAVFLGMGPFIGGVLTQYYTWRLVFWINLPIAFIGYLLTTYVVPQFPGKERSFDLLGFTTALLGISSIVVGIMEAKVLGWTSPWIWSMIAFGFILLVLLYKIDRRVEDPYIDFSIFKVRSFIGVNLCIFCTQFLLMTTIFWAIYFQTVLGFTPSAAGLLSMTSNIPIIVSAPLGGYLLDKYGPKLPLTIGFSTIALSLIWFILNIGNSNPLLILSAIIPFGCGVPLVFTPSFTTAMAQISPERRGLASGTSSMIRQFGGTLGLAIIGTILLNVQSSRFTTTLAENAATKNLNPKAFQGLLAKAPEAIEKLQTLPAGVQAYVEKSNLQAYIDSFWMINILAVIMACLGLIFTLTMIRKTSHLTKKQ